MMSDLQREALSVLTEVWELSPDIRLGQLFAHLGFLGEVRLGRSLGYIDDDELLSVLYKHREELLARLEGSSSQALLSNKTANSIAQASTSSEAAPAAEL